MTQQQLVNSPANAAAATVTPALVGGSTVDEFCTRWRNQPDDLL